MTGKQVAETASEVVSQRELALRQAYERQQEENRLLLERVQRMEAEREASRNNSNNGKCLIFD